MRAGGGSGNKAFDRIFIHARRTGILTMENMSLSEFPPQVCTLYDEASITPDEKVWELVDLTTLNLQHNGIPTIPPLITNLMHLQVLLLSHNKLVSLPSELFELTSIKKLDLSHNALTAIPNAIGALENLVELNVGHNSLRALPDDIVLLRRLELLTADENRLERLPEEIGDCRQLLRVKLNSNHLTSLPPSMSNLTRLEVFESKQNRLRSDPGAPLSRGGGFGIQPPSGGMPSFRALRNLVSLDLSENALSRIPELPVGGKLTQLFLGFNELTDCSELIPCTGLVHVDLHNNRIVNLPCEIGTRASQIKLLDLSNNELSDIPGELGLMPSLNKLLVDGNPLRKFPRGKLQSGASIAAFKSYLLTRIAPERLKELTAAGDGELEAELGGGSGTSTTGMVNSTNQDIEYALRESSSTGVLSLAKVTHPSQEFPVELFGLPNLKDLHTLDISSQPGITPAHIPTAIASLRHIKCMRAAKMAWQVLPLPCCTLTGLQELILTGNAIQQLPDNISALRQLKRIDLSRNQFSEWPTPLNALALTLTHIDLSSNRLSSLPSDFCARFADSLESLDLAGNRLTSLPVGWRWMSPRFELLNLDNNQLSQVPLELGLLTGLRTLALHGNPQKTVLYQVLSKGTPAIISALKNKIPIDSPLFDANDRRPEVDQPDDVVIDTAHASHYREQMRGPARTRNTNEQQQQQQQQQQPYRSNMHSQQRYQSEYEPDYRSERRHDDAGSSGYRRSPPHDAYAHSSPYRDSDRRVGSCDSGSDRSSSRPDSMFDAGESHRPSTFARPTSYADPDPHRSHHTEYQPQTRHQERTYQQRRERDEYEYGDRRRDERDAHAAYDSRRSASSNRVSSSQSRYDSSGSPYAPSRGMQSGESYGSGASQPPSASYDRAPSNTFGESRHSPPPSSSSYSSPDASIEIAELQSSIARLTNELENNLSIGSLQKMKIRKELASMKAELNRKQRG